MKKDIIAKEDVKILIDAFYSKVREDDVIGYIFKDIANVNWDHHLPKMYAFWEFLLLGMDTYQGNPFEVHKKLNQKVALQPEHFDRWVSLFNRSVDENFSGLIAEEAKNKANLIMMTWKPKFTE